MSFSEFEFKKLSEMNLLSIISKRDAKELSDAHSKRSANTFNILFFEISWRLSRLFRKSKNLSMLSRCRGFLDTVMESLIISKSW